jgi:hypothetical protein
MAKPDFRKYPWKWMPQAKDLSPGQKAYWMRLNDRQGNNKWAWPQVYSLADDCGVSERTINRWNIDMVAKGYLIVKRQKMRHGPNKGVTQNNYRVTHPHLDTSNQNDNLSVSQTTFTTDQNDKNDGSYYKHELVQGTDSGESAKSESQIKTQTNGGNPFATTTLATDAPRLAIDEPQGLIVTDERGWYICFKHQRYECTQCNLESEI